MADDIEHGNPAGYSLGDRRRKSCGDGRLRPSRVARSVAVPGEGLIGRLARDQLGGQEMQGRLELGEVDVLVAGGGAV